MTQQHPEFLMTGGSGKLGRVLQTMLSVKAPTRSEMDLLDPQKIHEQIHQHRWRAMIHLAAVTNPQQAAEHPQEAYRVNVMGTRHVAEQASQVGLKLYYVSTDYVFDGRVGDYREESPLSPANWYGATKAAAEMEVRCSGADHCIIRTSFRPNPWGFKTAFTNVFTSADYIDVIAKDIAQCIALNVAGTIHIGTPTKSFYDLARQRSSDIVPEECTDSTFPKKRFLNIDRWLTLKMKGTAS